MLLSSYIPLGSSILVIVNFKGSGLYWTQAIQWVSVLSLKIYGKNKFYNLLLCLTTFTVSKFCTVWILQLWEKKKKVPRATHWEASHTHTNPAQLSGPDSASSAAETPLMNMQRQSFTYKRNWYSHYGLWLIRPPFTFLCFENCHQENVLLSKLTGKDLVPVKMIAQRPTCLEGRSRIFSDSNLISYKI